jgi:hypothetical protein
MLNNELLDQYAEVAANVPLSAEGLYNQVLELQRLKKLIDGGHKSANNDVAFSLLTGTQSAFTIKGV